MTKAERQEVAKDVFLRAKREAIVLASCALSLVASVSVSAATIVPIFGIPLGGHLSNSIPVCKVGDIGNSAKECFVDKLTTYKDGTRSGMLQVSETSLPEWAAYSSIEVSLAKNGSIAMLSITQDNANLADVISSVSERFGQPTLPSLPDAKVSTVEWDLPNIFINITQWGDRCCDVAFWTPAAIAAHRRYVRSMTINRPTSP